MKIIMNPAMIVMFILGLILVFGYNAANLTSSIWLPVKLVLVFGLHKTAVLPRLFLFLL